MIYSDIIQKVDLLKNMLKNKRNYNDEQLMKINFELDKYMKILRSKSFPKLELFCPHRSEGPRGNQSSGKNYT